MQPFSRDEHRSNGKHRRPCQNLGTVISKVHPPLFLLLALALFLQHLLDNLLLLDEESPDDTVLDAVTAS